MDGGLSFELGFEGRAGIILISCFLFASLYKEDGEMEGMEEMEGKRVEIFMKGGDE